MSEYLLEMTNITKRFPGVLALNGVTLKVRPGTVHALMGENGAGKSTLMKCLFGTYHPDEGEVKLDDQVVNIRTAKQALNQGISMIHQELHPIRYRPVMENVWLGRFPMKWFAVDHEAMKVQTAELFKQLGLDVDPEALAGTLSASKLQLVEIARSVSYNAKVIIMDEPTSSLTDVEVEHLFRIINQLRREGRSIIYISHKMEEILQISDEVTIMRDGNYVGTWAASELTTDLIIKRMVGRDLTNRFPARESRPSPEAVLKVRNLCSPTATSFQNVSFDLHKGEILGIGGLVGAQRTELVEALFGLRPIAAGTVEKDGEDFKVRSVGDAKTHKFALLTEERRATGVFGILSVRDNTVIASQLNYSSFGVLDDTKRDEAAATSCKQLGVKTPSLDELMGNLSGGNQQKVLLGRWLLTTPDILILDEPTRGIDVGAKYEIYTIMHDLVNNGKSVIMISSEMPELLGMADRVMVMCEGKVSGFLEKHQFEQEEVMRLATQFAK